MSRRSHHTDPKGIFKTVIILWVIATALVAAFVFAEEPPQRRIVYYQVTRLATLVDVSTGDAYQEWVKDWHSKVVSDDDEDCPCCSENPDYDEEDCDETEEYQDHVQDGDLESNNNENDEDYEDR